MPHLPSPEECIRAVNLRLLQIATPEVLLLKQSSLPPEYLRFYADEQEHFSLKRFISYALTKLRNSAMPSLRQATTKYVLSTRTTGDLVGLPNNSCNLVHDNPSKVSVLKMSSFNTEESFVSEADNFIKNPEQEICLILVDMYVFSSKQLVNRIRQIIEEKDESRNNDSIDRPPKIWILLLHFPSAWLRVKASGYCCLFLSGWEFFYLDSIGGSSSFLYFLMLYYQ